jgi:ATP-dependent Clp protease adaptor protein ClpS
MATITETKSETKVDEILSQPFTLLLHNDDYNSFEHVIECLMKICKHSYEQASQCAYIVHFKGKCDVKRGTKEIVTKMYEQLKSKGLSVTMEENI